MKGGRSASGPNSSFLFLYKLTSSTPRASCDGPPHRAEATSPPKSWSDWSWSKLSKRAHECALEDCLEDSRRRESYPLREEGKRPNR